MNYRFLAFALPLAALAGAPSNAAAAVWGGFDTTRVNYDGGRINGSAHSGLRAIIVAHGDTVGGETPTLTAGYLAGVDVFYTSLLRNDASSILSGAEQAALQAWIANGGTLIVTADIYALPGYGSFTTVYGVTNYTQANGSSPGSVILAHDLTAGVSTFSFTTNSTFSYGGDALLLARDGSNNPFLIVMEPATGFVAGGRIAVFGDHNMFTDSYINNSGNTTLAQNLVAWAADTGCITDTECSDGDACNGAETCDNGQCVAGTPLDCDDLNLCTDDGCSAQLGCVNAPNSLQCNDGDPCTEGDVCSAGTCAGTAIDCDDDDACTDDSCDANGACEHTDNSASCDDGDLCTTDSCDGATGCVNEAIASCCNDNTDCPPDQVCDTNAHQCVPGATGGGGTGGTGATGGEGGTGATGGSPVTGGTGGAGGETSSDDGGCSCRLARRSTDQPASAPWLAVFGAALAGWRRRRR